MPNFSLVLVDCREERDIKMDLFTSKGQERVENGHLKNMEI